MNRLHDKVKQVEPNSAAVIAARTLGVSFGEYPPGTSPLMLSLTERATRDAVPVKHDV